MAPLAKEPIAIASLGVVNETESAVNGLVERSSPCFPLAASCGVITLVPLNISIPPLSPKPSPISTPLKGTKKDVPSVGGAAIAAQVNVAPTPISPVPILTFLQFTDCRVCCWADNDRAAQRKHT